MKTKNIIEGMRILMPYYNNQNGFHTGANHDVIYMYSTDQPLTKKDLAKMIELGWHQEHDEVDYNSDFIPSEYRLNETWHCYT